MAVGGIQLNAELVGLKELQESLGRIFTPTEKAKILKAALEKAIEPAFQKLKQITPLGPTGNLRRAVTKKVVPYPQDGNAAALVGFRRAGLSGSVSAAGGTVRKGPDRAFHQWWLEEGTNQRYVGKLSNQPYGRRGHLRRVKNGPAVEVRPHIVQKGQNAYIASSYNRLGPFKLLPTERASGRIQTDPAYQNAFFRKSKTPIVIPPMPAGGRGAPPLKTTFEATRSQIAGILQRELRLSLEQALNVISSRSSGTIG
jgi:hypothetical protein